MDNANLFYSHYTYTVSYAEQLSNCIHRFRRVDNDISPKIFGFNSFCRKQVLVFLVNKKLVFSPGLPSKALKIALLLFSSRIVLFSACSLILWNVYHSRVIVHQFTIVHEFCYFDFRNSFLMKNLCDIFVSFSLIEYTGEVILFVIGDDIVQINDKRDWFLLRARCIRFIIHGNFSKRQRFSRITPG